jgi:hypothetical protein
LTSLKRLLKIVSTIIHHMRSIIYLAHKTHRYDSTYKYGQAMTTWHVTTSLFKPIQLLTITTKHSCRAHFILHCLAYNHVVTCTRDTSVHFNNHYYYAFRHTRLTTPCSGKPTLPIYLSHPTNTTMNA